jgi:SAM-dependent methyltransferase
VSAADVRSKWRARGSGERYSRARWSSELRRARDPRLAAALLERHLAAGPASILDVPCGSGRLAPALRSRGRYVGLDVSPSMLEEARRALPHERWLAGDALRLPFRDGTFDAVVCCRLLHHLESAEVARLVRELVRVSRGLVVASFWDANSLPAWRRTLLGEKPGATRRVLGRERLREFFAHAGADVVGWNHSLRFVSRQAFVAARKRET